MHSEKNPQFMDRLHILVIGFAEMAASNFLRKILILATLEIFLILFEYINFN